MHIQHSSALHVSERQEPWVQLLLHRLIQHTNYVGEPNKKQDGRDTECPEVSQELNDVPNANVTNDRSYIVRDIHQKQSRSRKYFVLFVRNRLTYTFKERIINLSIRQLKERPVFLTYLPTSAAKLNKLWADKGRRMVSTDIKRTYFYPHKIHASTCFRNRIISKTTDLVGHIAEIEIFNFCITMSWKRFTLLIYSLCRIHRPDTCNTP